MSPFSCMGRKFPCCASAQLRFQGFYPSLKLEKLKSFIQVIILSNLSVWPMESSPLNQSNHCLWWFQCEYLGLHFISLLLLLCVCGGGGLENMSGNGSIFFFFFAFSSKRLNVLNIYLKLFDIRMFLDLQKSHKDSTGNSYLFPSQFLY